MMFFILTEERLRMLLKDVLIDMQKYPYDYGNVTISSSEKEELERLRKRTELYAKENDELTAQLQNMKSQLHRIRNREFKSFLDSSKLKTVKRKEGFEWKNKKKCRLEE